MIRPTFPSPSSWPFLLARVFLCFFCHRPPRPLPQVCCPVTTGGQERTHMPTLTHANRSHTHTPIPTHMPISVLPFLCFFISLESTCLCLFFHCLRFYGDVSEVSFMLFDFVVRISIDVRKFSFTLHVKTFD